MMDNHTQIHPQVTVWVGRAEHYTKNTQKTGNWIKNMRKKNSFEKFAFFYETEKWFNLFLLRNICFESAEIIFYDFDN